MQIPTQRAPEVRLDLVSAGPVPEEQRAPGRLRRRTGLVALTITAGAAGAGWGVQLPGDEPPPLLVTVQKVATGSSWGTLAVDLPGTSCGALVDFAELSSTHYAVERTLPCADGSEVRARVTVDEDDDGQRQLRIDLVAHEAGLSAAPPVTQR